MDIQIRQSPAFAVARAVMAPGETITAESGAMMATSGGVTVESKMQGGLMSGLKRSVLGGESLFLSNFTAPAEGGWVDCAANLPGDAVTISIDGGYNLTRGAFLCCESTVTINTKWGGLKNLVGGEGGFLVRAEGRGQVVAACYGSVEQIRLAEGETLVVDTGHLVAFGDGTQFQMRKIAKGVMQSLKSGEGFVFDFQGPGELYVQTRNPSELITWLTTVLPFSRA